MLSFIHSSIHVLGSNQTRSLSLQIAFELRCHLNITALIIHKIPHVKSKSLDREQRRRPHPTGARARNFSGLTPLTFHKPMHPEKLASSNQPTGPELPPLLGARLRVAYFSHSKPVLSSFSSSSSLVPCLGVSLQLLVQPCSMFLVNPRLGPRQSLPKNNG